MTLQHRNSRDFLNLVATKEKAGAQWWKIVNKKADEPATLMIYDEIGYWGLTAQDLIAQVSEISGPLNVHINSPGGEVFEGKAIYTYLADRGDVAVTVTSLAASIASVIAMAADPGQLFISKHAQMMIHDAWGACMGNASDMRELADLMDKLSNSIAGIYADRTGLSVDHWRDLMKAETWFDDQEAVNAGLADKVLDPKAAQDSSRAPSLNTKKPPTEATESAPASDTDNCTDDDEFAALAEALQDDNEFAALAAALGKVDR
jgi:ATP-dependent protease ClpP protease subunit